MQPVGTKLPFLSQKRWRSAAAVEMPDGTRNGKGENIII